MVLAGLVQRQLTDGPPPLHVDQGQQAIFAFVDGALQGGAGEVQLGFVSLLETSLLQLGLQLRD